MPRVPRILLSDRDIAYLDDLGEYGLLTSTQSHTRHFKNVTFERCRQKLVQYRDTGMIKSTKLQIWYASNTNRKHLPTLHFLTPRGAAAVEQPTGRTPKRILRSKPSPATLWHRLQIVHVRLALDDAAKTFGLRPLHWIMDDDLRPDTPAKTPINKCSWLYHEFQIRQKLITCHPDAAVVLPIPQPQAQVANIAMFFEIDRSTEALAKVHRKLPGYQALFDAKSFPYWSDVTDLHLFRVFWIVPSLDRLENIATELKDEPIAQCFRFTTFDHCTPHRILTHPIWQDLTGDPKTIFVSTAPLSTSA